MDFQEDPFSGTDRPVHRSSREVPIITEEIKLTLVLRKGTKLKKANSQEFSKNSSQNAEKKLYFSLSNLALLLTDLNKINIFIDKCKLTDMNYEQEPCNRR